MKSSMARVLVVIAALALASVPVYADCGSGLEIQLVPCPCGTAKYGYVCVGRGVNCFSTQISCGDGACFTYGGGSGCPGSNVVKRGHEFDVARLENGGGSPARVASDQNKKGPAPSRCGVSEEELNDWLSHPRSEGSR